MSAKIISGTEIREQILEEIETEVKEIKEKHGVVPGLVTILVGESPEEDLLALIDKYNNDDSIHGILVQLPLPKHIDEKKVLNAIDPDKDVDGFHPVNVGRLMIGGSEVKFPPCTPAGVAAGVPGLVKPEWIKPGACVIDVGVNRVGEKPSAKDPNRMVAILRGDVDYDAAKEIAGSITPVPGGVGPMTITMLMKNTLRAAKLAHGLA
jgi:methylenetetrahydrofolate dehydrogenase (NADP+)/methenyltetrahydrofolate cyclohydrolase